MNAYSNRPAFFNSVPVVVKNLIIINVLMLVATEVMTQLGVDFFSLFGLHHWSSEKFRPHQLVTHIFMHGGFMHIFFNMFMLWMFGKNLEMVWGPRRFLTFYMVCGLGAAGLQLAVNTWELSEVEDRIDAYKAEPNPNDFVVLAKDYLKYVDPHFIPGIEAGTAEKIIYFVEYEWRNESQENLVRRSEAYADLFLRGYRNVPMVGASGAVYGILTGFGMLFPNTLMIMIFLPIPIRAKYLVIIMGLFELYLGFQNAPGDNVAHFAHVGGALVGFLLLKYWSSRGRTLF